MSDKLNKDEILKEMLGVLVRGWGRIAVYGALDELVCRPPLEGKSAHQSVDLAETESKAVNLIEELEIAGERRALMLRLARDYDAGTAFPRIADVRAFLASHNDNAKELRTRHEAFRRMIPILRGMSEKGLEKILSRSRHSGPTELGLLSDAIRDVGKSRRGLGSSENDDNA